LCRRRDPARRSIHTNINKTEDGYVNEGSTSNIKHRKALKHIRSRIQVAVEQALPKPELIEGLEGIGDTVIKEALKQRVDAGEFAVVGTGKRGSPFLYYLPLTENRRVVPTQSVAAPRVQNEHRPINSPKPESSHAPAVLEVLRRKFGAKAYEGVHRELWEAAALASGISASQFKAGLITLEKTDQVEYHFGDTADDSLYALPGD
jgi:hypothetical protein